MAGYSDNREQNYEIKYLRKVLGQVDKRIIVPESISGDSLRALIEDVERPAPRDIAGRRKSLRIRSWIAYAAAFVLIIALFYSMEIYRPEMINGGMKIESPEPAAQGTVSSEQAPEARANITASPKDKEGEVFVEEPDLGTTEAQPEPAAAAEAFDADAGLGVGGLESSLFLEQDGYAYYITKNDETDPDKSGVPYTIDVVDLKTSQLESQTGISDSFEFSRIDRLFVSENRFILLGKDDTGYGLRCYDGTGALVLSAGFDALIDARLYKNTVYVVTGARETAADGDNVIILPNSLDEAAVISIIAYDIETFEIGGKIFVGANGTVQLHNLNAYIHYLGVGDDGEETSCIAQVNLNGSNIELGPVF